jgi:hypothetical protein
VAEATADQRSDLGAQLVELQCETMEEPSSVADRASPKTAVLFVDCRKTSCLEGVGRVNSYFLAGGVRADRNFPAEWLLHVDDVRATCNADEPLARRILLPHRADSQL